MQSVGYLIPALALFIFGILEAFNGLYQNSKRTKDDYLMELASLVLLPALVQPGIMLLVGLGLDSLLPTYKDALTSVNIWWMIVAFLLFDDLTQYWWHRLAHVNPWFWKLHRPHHTAPQMGVLVTYRNAVLYYAMMPGIWFSSVLIWLGMGWVYVWYVAVKLVVIIGAHSDYRWDRFLYRYRLLHPFAWVVERTISTPATHFAHHGLDENDSVSNPNGNFGNLLFLWDVIFGTAKITRKYPADFGTWNPVKDRWYVELFYPFIRSRHKDSELH